MLASVLKERVASDLERLWKDNPLAEAVKSGSMSQRQLHDYLNNLMYFFRHSVLHLDIARRRALELGMSEVAAFYELKIQEEKGHDRWAQQDLAANGRPQDDVDLARVAPATHRILANSVDLIERDPELYLVYMFYHEYMTVIGAERFLGALDQNCGVPEDRVTAVTYHAKLDVDHVAEDLEVIEAVARRSPTKAKELVEVMDEIGPWVAEYYGGMVSLFY